MHSREYKPTPTRQARPERKRFARRSPRTRGAVLVLTLMGAFFIAALIGYVFNAGRHAQMRQQTQNAADATVISGAGYVARSFNTIAMNNVEISRLIAVVQMLDAVPLSVEYTLLDVQATLERVQEQLRGGTGDQFADITLQQIEQELLEQERLLTEMDQFFNRGSYDVREMTYYNSEFGRGELWKAMESLEAINIATIDYIQDLTQYTAMEAGLRNMTGGESGTEAVAAMAPFDMGIYARRYQFDDFRRPVTRGQLPDWVDDEVTNRGPYDAIFGWRREQRESIEIPNPNYDPDTTQRDPFGSRWSGGTGRGGQSRNIRIGSRLLGYRTYGTWQWLGDIIRNRIDEPDVLYNSQFVTRVNRMGGNKLNYLWPGSARQWVFLDPQWITDFAQAEQIIAARTPRVAYTQFIRMDFEQHFVNGVPTGPEVMDDWHILRPRRGHTDVPGLTKTRDHVWEDEAELNWQVQRRIDDDTVVVDEHKTVLRRIFVWAGINVGPEIVIRDPNNFSDRSALPAPIDFDHDSMPRPTEGQPGQPYSPFTYLGITKQPNTPQMWRSLFSTSAYDGHTAIAQASVFNNHSWDLWTQMWHAQLEPVQEYSQWMSMLQGQMGTAADLPGMNVQELQDTVHYLQSIESLAPVMLNH